VHLLEGRLDVAQADALGDELLQREAALQVQATGSGSRAVGRQSPYQLRLERPPRPKKSIMGRSSFISGVGTPTSTTVPARSRA
jgi:hypothetical protein